MAKTDRYLMYIAYIGSRFRGSQIQKDPEITVQGTVESALARCFGGEGARPYPTCFTSRTDSGVHAFRSAFHVDLPVSHRNRVLEPFDVVETLNQYLLKVGEIRILEAHKVPKTFHARYLCREKCYMYRFGVFKHKEFENQVVNKILPVSESERTFITWSEFDFQKADETAKLFLGERDFGGIVGRPSHNERPTICEIKSITIEKVEPLLPIFDPIAQQFDYYHFTCRGTRFLFHMLRRMVGIMLAVATDRITLEHARDIVEKADPTLWTPIIKVAPSHALYLVDVVFQEGSFSFEEKNDKTLVSEKIEEADDSLDTQ